MSKGTPHKHAALIKAWADGAEIEFRFNMKWLPCSSPSWHPNQDYRIKPEPSDLEKYGVQKGDVWRIGGHQYMMGGKLPDSLDGYFTLDARVVFPGASSELMFCRHVVDKL